MSVLIYSLFLHRDTKHFLLLNIWKVLLFFSTVQFLSSYFSGLRQILKYYVQNFENGSVRFSVVKGGLLHEAIR